LIVAPEALNRFYLDEPAHQKVGATWMTREDRLADIADTVAYLDGVQADVFARQHRASRHVHVLGFSQGAAAACRWAALGSIAPDRVILWGGEVPPDIDLARLRTPVVFVHGRADEMITPKVAATNAARLAQHGIAHRLVPFDGGHAIDAAVLAAVAATDR
jgi:predicted esterase